MSAAPRHEAEFSFLDSVLKEVPQPIWVVDATGLVVFANPASVMALGYDDAAELLGRPSHDTVHYRHPDGSPYPVADCPMLRPRTTGETVHGEDEWFIRRDGSMFPISFWSAPIQIDGQRGAVLAFSNLTEQLAAAQAARERDAAEIRVSESRAAQRRILEAATSARRELARDLHDGAQQQLVNVLISIRLAAEAVGENSPATSLLAEAAEQAQQALRDLRELVAGVHPTVLSTRGLHAAVEALATRSPVPVDLSPTFDQRLAAEVESSAYFVVAEALTNAIKHSHASKVAIDLRLGDGQLDIAVRDDGVGGAADAPSGTGLIGLRDRLEALDGVLEVESSARGGTTISAQIPTSDAADPPPQLTPAGG